MDPTVEVSILLGVKKCQPASKDNCAERTGWCCRLDPPHEGEHSYDTCMSQYMVYSLSNHQALLPFQRNPMGSVNQASQV